MRLERVIDFQNIGPGKTAILTLPLGPTYEALHIDLNGGLVVTDIDKVIGLIDNKPFWTVTGEQILKQINYDMEDGRQLPTDKVTLDFTLRGAKSQGGERGATAQASEILLTCLPSAVMQSLAFTIKLKPTAPVGANMTALMQLAEPTANPYIMKQFETQSVLAGAATHSILLPTGEAGGMMQKLFLHRSAGSVGQITGIELKNNGVTICEATPEEIKYIQSVWYGKTQQVDLLVLDFHLQGMRSKLFNTVVGKNTYMKLTTDGAVTLDICARFIDPINRK
jgi:hypothetical protein